MSIHLGGVTTYRCFIVYILSSCDQTNDIHFSGLSTQRGLTVLSYYLLPQVWLIFSRSLPLTADDS